MTFAGLFVYQRQRKEICPISHAYSVLICLMSLFGKIVLNFCYCVFLIFFFFDETVFPLLLLNSCEDYSSGSGIVTNRKGKCMMKLVEICRVYNIYVSIDILCKPTEAFPVSLSLQDWAHKQFQRTAGYLAASNFTLKNFICISK